MKSNQLAESFILVAEKCLAAKNFPEALENYNHCLRFAVSKSQVASDAFAGRSKVYHETKQFQQSLTNVQSAIDACQSLEKSKSLQAFHETVKKIASDCAADNVERSFFSLTQPKHGKIPFIADCLEVRENDIYGRYIVTQRDLLPGDIVVVEEPFYKVLDPQKRHTRCAICLQQNMMNLFPCGKCSDGE